MRADRALHVDRTALIHRMVTAGRCYFLSRPSRFGKSLLVYTLETYFEGRRDLLAGLAIAQLEPDWTQATRAARGLQQR